ncbi:MAG: EutP/PduV family microcompartment system protein [Rhodoferax sp.]|nr:EutP/PduV family microcompartment system protein [Rhodoferax sp.]MDP3654850.1 EutP/PduV family microcompartment system protein [Rhodoferax sp.]
MAPRFMLIGQIGAGKTTLFNGLFGKDEPARKTQVMEFEGNHGIDTPGEYFSHPRMYHALITMSAEVERLMVVHPADVFDCRLPPGLLDVYAHKSIDAVVTKMDRPCTDLPRVERLLRDAGVHGRIFPVSIHDLLSIATVRSYLLGNVSGEPAPCGKAP